uniref:Uncharacterized protein n=3 Tax=Candidatus Kentrum sp. TUN TaxID=2126343 RepID=A0A451ABX4_9GAMM|nr:MAG: hypothetical protein BECKTUN1418D_GA0071000_12174 [Candidatus Kentron sp. TUN]
MIIKSPLTWLKQISIFLAMAIFTSQVSATTYRYFYHDENSSIDECYLSHYPTIDFPRYFTVIKGKFLTLTAPVE